MAFSNPGIEIAQCVTPFAHVLDFQFLVTIRKAGLCDYLRHNEHEEASTKYSVMRGQFFFFSL